MMTFDPLKKGVVGVGKFPPPKFFENLHQNNPENEIKSISAAKSSGITYGTTLKCASTEHKTRECTSKTYMCINCSRKNLSKTDHPAYSH